MPLIIRLFSLGFLLALPSGNSITLRLRAGPHAPADMPPGVVVINVPVYPRARPWHRPYVIPLGGSTSPYKASDVNLPPRSPASYLPGDIVRVQIRYHFLNAPASERTIHRLVTTRHAIGTLVRAINALPRSDEAAHSCPAIDRDASLVFSKPSGPPIRVETDPGCIGVIIVGYP